MSSALDLLLSRIRRTSFAQAVRLIERDASTRGDSDANAEIGGDARFDAEPVHFTASERMSTVSNDIAAGKWLSERTVELDVNILGLAGASPALPAYYSEIQLQRRRLRDPSFSDFLNIFNHRAVSFFYRIFRKYNWTVSYERERARGEDGITQMLLALGGVHGESVTRRLAVEDELLAPLAGHLGNRRHSATSIATTLKRMTGLTVKVVEADPQWMSLPVEERSRIGDPMFGRFARLGTEGGDADSAILGNSVIDVQHHYCLELGPLSYEEFLCFQNSDGMQRRIAEICSLMTGMAYRPRLRLLIAPEDVPPLQLGVHRAPALLGRTTWMAISKNRYEALSDCTLPLEISA